MTYTVDKKEYSFHSSANQRIINKLVDREVIMVASHLVSDMSDKLMFDSCSIYEVAENLYLTDDQIIEDEMLEDASEEEQGERIETIRDNGEDIQEPLEWWFVSPYAYRQLKDRGEVVYDSDYGYLWGRTCSGQAIMLDSVWCQMAYDMEILEGQKYEWEV